ncbi:unnamed protein product, partial [Discosporangium mesarthrocarpum]
INSLSKDASVEGMISYLTEPAPADASDNRRFKFPYMSCEIICCEVPEILDALLGEGEGCIVDARLAQLFSVLNVEGEIDSYLAGYFEKVVTVLVKNKCTQLVSFVNRGGQGLFLRVVSHLGDFSVMQVAKRLLLPKHAALQDIDGVAMMADGSQAAPGGMGDNDENLEGNGGGGDSRAAASGSEPQWCTWTDDEAILKALMGQLERGAGGGKGRRVAEMAEAEDVEKEGKGGVESEEGGGGEQGGGEESEVHLHLAELLLALISQSLQDSPLLQRMYSWEVIRPLVSAASLSKEQGVESQGTQAALQILDALMQRLIQPQPFPHLASSPHFPGPGGVSEGSNLNAMGEGGIEEGGGGGGSGGGAEGGGGVGGGGGAQGPEVGKSVLERGILNLLPHLCGYLRGHSE